jgi:hypothetical protein
MYANSHRLKDLLGDNDSLKIFDGKPGTFNKRGEKMIGALVCVIILLFTTLIVSIVINSKMKEEIESGNPTQAVPVKQIMKEIDAFIMENVTRMVWERLVNGQDDPAQAKLDISDPQEPYYQGVIARIISSMSPALKSSFYSVYRRTKTDDSLINYVHQMMELYSIILVNRSKVIEKSVHNELRAVESMENYDGPPPIDNISTFVNLALVEQVVSDITSFSNILETITNKKEASKPDNKFKKEG